mgnify:CR=1 FL=1
MGGAGALAAVGTGTVFWLLLLPVVGIAAMVIVTLR